MQRLFLVADKDMSNWVGLKEACVNDQEKDVEIDLTPLAAKMPSGVDAARIAVDIESVAKICSASRVRTLTVDGTYRHEEAPGVGGANNKGGATMASAAKSEKRGNDGASRAVYPLNQAWREVHHWCNFTNESIALNLQDLMNQPDFNVRDTESWANFIRKNLKKELWRIAKQKHKFSMDRFEIELLSPLIACAGGLLPKYGPEESPPLKDKLKFLVGSASIVGSLFAGISDSQYVALAWIFSMGWLNIRSAEMAKEIAESLGREVKYDPATLLTLGQFEWDRLLSTGMTLLTNEMVKVATPELWEKR